jgi:hypothetical protein
MALSQYVAINFLTKFDKKGLERATKELKGFDKVVATGAFRLRAFAKAGGVAAAAGLTIFAKKAVDAALAQERLDKSLKLTLSSIGKGGFATEVNAFIQSLQSATNVSEEQLVPALQQLIAQTGDLEASQAFLTLALDTSAGTGKDLSTVIDAITKAAVGNYRAIGTLGIGISAAQAKTLGFAGSMQLLQKYTGSAEAATLTLDGQVKAFKISAGEATETLGQGMLTAFAIISGGQPLIKNLGTDLEVAARQFSNIFVGIAATTKEKGLGVYVELAKVALQGLVGETSALQNLEKAGIKALSTEKQTANQREDRLKDTKKLLTFDQIIADIQKKILATEKLNTKEKTAQAAIDDKKRKLMAMFDLEQINLQAALTRKLSAEDETRVRILQKLADGTAAAVNEAQRYADILQVIEDGQITTGEVEMLAKKWGITTTEVLIYLRTLFASNDELRKMLALLDEVNKKKKQEESQPTTPIGLTKEYQLEQFATNTDPRIQLAVLSGQAPSSFGQEVVDRLRQQGATPAMAAMSGRYSAQAIAYYQGLLDIPRMAEGGIVNSPTLAMIGEAGTEAVIPLDKMGGFGTTVNVNVAGSVISEGELQSVIQDALYNLNRAGAVTQLTNLGR